MDPGGNELDASLPQSENPCLIVEDSQPDSVALEDDPEGSYRAVLARRLSSLQPSARSPVLVSVMVSVVDVFVMDNMSVQVLGTIAISVCKHLHLN